MKRTKLPVRDMTMVALFAALIAIMAQISIPTPFGIPFTMQVFAVLLTAGILGSRLSLWTLAVYVLLGAVGLPVFSQGNAGLRALVGPTGGFIVGFFLAAFLVGWLSRRFAEKGTTPFKRYAVLLAPMILGILVIHIFGIVQYSLVMTRPLGEAFGVVSAAFLPLDLVKAALAAWFAQLICRRLPH